MQKNDELTISDIATAVKGNSSLIIFFSAIIFLGVVAGNIITPSSYIAQTTIFSMEENPLDQGFTDLKQIPREAEKEYLPLVPILTSHKITQNIAQNIGVENIITLKAKSTGQTETKDILLQQAAGAIYGKTRIFSRANLIYILVDWKEPVMAATLANAHIDSLSVLLNKYGVQSKYYVVDRAVYPRKNVLLKQVNIAMGLLVSVFLAVFGVVMQNYRQRLKNG